MSRSVCHRGNRHFKVLPTNRYGRAANKVLSSTAQVSADRRARRGMDARGLVFNGCEEPGKVQDRMKGGDRD